VGQKGSWQTNLPKVLALNPYWNYSWGPKRIVQQPAHIEFVPMLWGYAGNAERFAATMANDILPQVQAGHVKRLLGFNEPDNPVQSNLSISKALDAWPIMELLNLPLVSPSCWHPEREVSFLCSSLITGLCMNTKLMSFSSFFARNTINNKNTVDANVRF
jgi:hypothetical protein